jgi:hypothetical protein
VKHRTQTAAPTATARPSVPVTDAEYRDLCDCRCSKVRWTHTAGVCAQVEAVAR